MTRAATIAIIALAHLSSWPSLLHAIPAKAAQEAPVLEISPAPAAQGDQANPSSSGRVSSARGTAVLATPGVAAATLRVDGKVTFVEGEPVAGASVWVAPFASPAERLTETQTSTTGLFSLKASLGSEASATGQFVVGASHPDCLKAQELLEPGSSTPDSKITLLLRRSGESFEEPDLDVVEGWLLPRLSRLPACRHDPGVSCKIFAAALARYRKQPGEWTTLGQVLQAAQQASELPEARLLASLALMRLGAWAEAGKILASFKEADALPERFLLEGIRWNLLRRPEEAKRDLERALTDQRRDALVELELGRAAVLAEDWSTALQWLDTALPARRLAPQAHYLRARSLMAQGDIEQASEEAKLLTKGAGRKPLPPAVLGFVADIQQRLQERSIQPLQSVLNQPVSGLQRAVTGLLKDLDPTGPPPPGGLEQFLKKVGANIDRFFRDFSNTAATEVIRQSRLDSKGRPRAVRSEEFYYVFLHHRTDKGPWLEEFRMIKRGQSSAARGLDEGYMATSRFASSLIVFHPGLQPGMSFRFLGRQPVAGRLTYVIGFAQKPEASIPLGSFLHSQGRVTPFYLQGIAWISADQQQILRLRTDLLRPIPEVQLTRETSEIDYRPCRFLSSARTFWLPNRVTVSVEWQRKRLRNEHIFSQFRLFKVDTETKESSGVDEVTDPSEKSPSSQ